MNKHEQRSSLLESLGLASISKDDVVRARWNPATGEQMSTTEFLEMVRFSNLEEHERTGFYMLEVEGRLPSIWSSTDMSRYVVDGYVDVVGFDEETLDPIPEQGFSGAELRKARQGLANRDGPLCQGCGIHGEDMPVGQSFHVDHKLPIARGGTDAFSNLQLLCPPCNQSKGAKTMQQWMKFKGRLR